ncbi:L-threonylcarbamoyladenylate synthase [Cardinium endosymbiont of Tipula unca]|uniref:L-threonylcarbamoyladenylate synthase n=1 Tax=Cardinium endosymbiont of Tipula unca TaxID=3066216 RepID=UPI0030D10784
MAEKLLLAGKVVAIPTETVYGLAASAYNFNAVLEIFNIKERPSFDPLIVHAYDLDRTSAFVEAIPTSALLLAKAFWPGPLTLLLPKKKVIPDLVTAGSPCVGVRVPNHVMTLDLLKRLPFPLAAPSANPFGYISPTTPQHVFAQLGNKIDYILDGGACNVGIESTIVSFEKRNPTVLRLGGIAIAALEAVVGPIEIVLQHAPNQPCMPGSLLSHYAPNKKLIMGNLSKLIPKYKAVTDRVGILSFQKQYELIPKKNQVILSPQGCLKEAAQNLFHGLRLLDGLPIDIILAAYLPSHGIGAAINDRLQRAQHDHK